LKNKIKITVILIITIIITSSITAYATYNYLAKDIKYTKADGTETNLENSLNELYSLYNKEFKYIDRVVATKNETSSYQSISNSKELEKGKYFIIIVRSNRNDSGAGNYTKETNPYGTLTGGDEAEFLFLSRYGEGNDGKGYSNQTTMFYNCTLNEKKVVTFTSEATDDDTNQVMFIFQI